MRIQVLQHAAFEGPGSIGPALLGAGHVLTNAHLYAGDALLDAAQFDALVIMGGPMGAYDEARYAWLMAEKRCIREAIDQGKPVLGVCLGAQLIAAALGARVYPQGYREIGWFPLERAPTAAASRYGDLMPTAMEVFHWHGDTFELPPGATLLASSAACRHQAFAVGDRVLGLQFHLEVTEEGARQFTEDGAAELDGSRYVQNAAEMLAQPARFTAINAAMARLLTCWLES